jgi:O-antigen ligase
MERSVAVFVAVLYGSELLRLFLNSETGEPSPLFRAATMTLYGLTGLLLLPHVRAVLRRIAQAPLLAMLLVLPVVSTLWSTSSGDTFIRGSTLLASSFFGYYLAIRYAPRDLLRIVGLAGFLIAVVSFALVFGIPSAGRHIGGPWDGTWRGAFLHKNSLGGGMALYCAAMLLVMITGRGLERWLVGIAFAVSCVLLLGSRSTTGIVAFLASVATIVILRNALSRLRPYLLAIVVVMLPLVSVLVLAIDDASINSLTVSLGRDASFSGRVPLWLAVWPWIKANLLLGYGYEAFWVPAQTGVRVIALQIFYRPFYSHNGVLELMLSLGLVGLVLFAGVLVSFLVRLVRLLWREPRSVLGAFCVVFVIGFFLRNVTEVAILTRNDLLWCLFVALYLMLIEVTHTGGRRRNTSGARNWRTAPRPGLARRFAPARFT